jgi:hypothetical protein
MRAVFAADRIRHPPASNRAASNQKRFNAGGCQLGSRVSPVPIDGLLKWLYSSV